MKNPTLKLCLIAVLVIFTFTASAQKGNNIFQPSVQLNIPTGDLADVAKTGYGVALKAMFGIGEATQFFTLEGGFNHFGVKDKFLTPGVDAEYRSIPFYAGYRYMVKQFSFETQAGVAVNTIYASNSFALASQTKTYFAWAAGLGYEIKQFEIFFRYQHSDVKDTSSNITFAALSLGYNF